MTYFLIILIFISAFCLYGLWTNRQLELEAITLPISDLPEELANLKILHVSDIHLRRLRVPLTTLLKTSQDTTPDLILITGDTIDRTESLDSSKILTVINDFAQIAPTFVIEGNHETSSGQLETWRQLIISSQAQLLENQFTTIEINEQMIGLIGLRNEETDLPAEVKAKTTEQSLNLLLAHHPELFNEYAASFKDYPIQAVFSGHAHGGQIRLPGIDGLLSPHQGWFPKLTNGAYLHQKKENFTLVVSRGLSNSKFPFRINNKPHLLLVTLVKS